MGEIVVIGQNFNIERKWGKFGPKSLPGTYEFLILFRKLADESCNSKGKSIDHKINEMEGNGGGIQ
jgi:hypothetical protein